MLTYRKIDYAQDVPEIVTLLRTSLSDNHTTAFFLWKHYENPFGKSYGLLACDNDKIVGVRMFMKWVFTNGTNEMNAIRPVDTITHPDYRGRGIFKKLTLRGLEECHHEYSLIFNTPNKNSLPGYLKMGWKKYTKELNYYLAFSPKRSKYDGALMDVSKLPVKDYSHSYKGWATKMTSEFVNWRYNSSEYKTFNFINNGLNVLGIIYKVRRLKKLKTLIITQALGDNQYKNDALAKLCSIENTNFLYYLKDGATKFSYNFALKRNSSVVVIKNDENDVANKLLFTCGDLEGKL